jgi:SAM-dependent methyltransferase
LLAAPPGPEVRAVRALVRAAGLRSFDDPILDVGSGPVPERLQQLGAAGFRRLEGIDPMLPADAGVPGIPVRRWTIEEVTGRYALVTFHHSFEHVPEPRATMAAAAAILRPGGTVLIRTPVMGSWFWDRFGVSWWELDAPRHLYVHTAASLRHLAAEVGLTLVHVTHESSFLEILASDQIARDIPWRDPRSYWSAPPGTFGPAAIAEARETARRINEEGRAGRAAFYFRGAS